MVGTGAGALAVNGLVVADSNASLQVADSFSVTGGPLQELNGTIEVLGTGSLTAGAYDQSGPRARLLLDQGATLDLLGRPNLGFADAGTLVAPSGGTIGLQAMGSVVVTGAVLNAGGFIAVGENGGGTGASMLVQNGPTQGATVTDTYAALSSDPTSFGSLTISGPATSWTDAGDPADTGSTRGDMLVGSNNSTTLVPYAGAASLLVTNQATLTETNYASIGNSLDSAGTVTVSDQARWIIGTPSGQAGFLTVGRNGQGGLLITDNGTTGQGGLVAVGGGGTVVSQGVTKVVSYAVDIGQQVGAVGSVTVTGGLPASPTGTQQGSTLTAAGAVIVGESGAGALSVLNGGLVDVTTASAIVIGKSLGGAGAVKVDGPGALLEAPSGGLVVGAGGLGALAVAHSGQVIVNSATVNGGVALDAAGTLSVTTDLTVTSFGRVGGGNLAHLDAGTVTDFGTIEAGTGAFAVNGTLAGSGTVQIDAGATLTVGGPVTGTNSFVFATGSAPALLDLVTPGATLANAVSNLQNGDQIALENFSTITDATVNGSTLTVTGTIAGAAAQVELTNVSFAAGASQTFRVGTATDPFTATTVAAVQLACFAAGTRIATARGAVPVERLGVGDRVRTAGGALRPVRWIGWRTIDLTRHPDPHRAQPIRILADAFADGVPARDLVLSPDHAVFDRGRLIPIRLLVNDATIRRETRRRKVTYFHVELDSHDLLLAEGLAAESYIDTGNRGIFENAPEPLVLHPDFTDPAAQNRHRIAASCAPLTDTPAEVEPLWFRLADRALALGVPVPEPEFTDDPALALRVGGRRLRPLAREGACYRFAVPAGPAWLVSRIAYPSDARPWLEDQRRLGVMVRRMTLLDGGDGVPIPLDHPSLVRGWWAPETDGVSHWRWTDGAAALPVGDAPSVLEVEVAGTLPYPLPAPAARVRRRVKAL